MDRESTVQRLRTTTEQLEQANRLQEQVDKSVGRPQSLGGHLRVFFIDAKAILLPDGFIENPI